MQKQFDIVLKELLSSMAPHSAAGTFVLAVSGGVDSLCMADLFLHSSLHPAFVMAHCNFHLRGAESDGDETAVAAWADENGIVLHRNDFDTSGFASEHGVSIEMAAREMRYRWFASLCSEFGYAGTCVAHNANDNAETLMLNLLRGSGIEGMTGMSAVSANPFSAEYPVLRPLLKFTRRQIEGYAFGRGLKWREDSTNASTAYKRNKLRNAVFPIFEEINPSFIRTFNRTSGYLAEAAGIVGEYCSRHSADVARLEGGNRIISVSALMKSGYWRTMLYHILEPYGFNSSVVTSLADLMASSRTFAGKRFISEKYEIITGSDEFVIRLLHPDEDSGSADKGRFARPGLHGHLSGRFDTTSADEPVMVVRGEGRYRFNGTSFSVEIIGYDAEMSLKAPRGVILADADRLPFPFVCRRWMKGDWLLPLGLRGRKKVSDLFTDLKYNLLQKESAIVAVRPQVPEQVRDDSSKGYIRDDNSRIAAVLGERIDDSVKVTASTKRIVRIIMSPQA